MFDHAPRGRAMAKQTRDVGHRFRNRGSTIVSCEVCVVWGILVAIGYCWVITTVDIVHIYCFVTWGVVILLGAEPLALMVG